MIQIAAVPNAQGMMVVPVHLPVALSTDEA